MSKGNDIKAEVKLSLTNIETKNWNEFCQFSRSYDILVPVYEVIHKKMQEKLKFKQYNYN